jgi:hypothetical protein
MAGGHPVGSSGPPVLASVVFAFSEALAASGAKARVEHLAILNSSRTLRQGLTVPIMRLA